MRDFRNAKFISLFHSWAIFAPQPVASKHGVSLNVLPGSTGCNKDSNCVQYCGMQLGLLD